MLARRRVVHVVLGCSVAAVAGPIGCSGSSSRASGDASIDALARDAAADATRRGDSRVGDASVGDSTLPRDAGADAAPADAGPSLSATITVNPGTKLGAIGPGFVGLSYEKSSLEENLFRGDNAALVAMFGLLGPSILRVGGNSVDRTVWQGFDAGVPAGDAAAPSVITAADVDALAAFAHAAGWRVLYGVNMKLSNPRVAEAEAEYAASQLGDALFGFEIGNEPDLYDSVVDAPDASWDYAEFTTVWRSFESAMRAGVPGASFTGPAAAGNYKTWTVPFARFAEHDITTLTQHYYVANGQSDASTMSLLLSGDPALSSELAALSLAAVDAGVPNRYRISECNSFYHGGRPGVSDGYGTALWVIDFLFANAEHGSTGTNLHGGGDSPGYTPIADSKGSVVGARPELYGMLMFTRAGQGAVLGTTGAPSSINFSAYAVAPTGGATRVVLSNKDAAMTVHATVEVGGAVSAASAMRLQGPSLEATTGVTLGGAAIGADGSFTPEPDEPLATSGSSFTVDVPPASAVLVTTR